MSSNKLTPSETIPDTSLDNRRIYASLISDEPEWHRLTQIDANDLSAADFTTI